MNNEAERLNDERREEILQKSPFLRVYLDTSFMVLQNEEWKSAFEREKAEAIEDIRKNLGGGWVEQVNLQRPFAPAETFNPTLSGSEKLDHIKNLILFGYQIRTPDDLSVIMPELIAKLRMDDVINPKIESDLVVSQYVGSLLRGGANVNNKSLPTPQSDNS